MTGGRSAPLCRGHQSDQDPCGTGRRHSLEDPTLEDPTQGAGSISDPNDAGPLRVVQCHDVPDLEKVHAGSGQNNQARHGEAGPHGGPAVRQAPCRPEGRGHCPCGACLHAPISSFVEIIRRRVRASVKVRCPGSKSMTPQSAGRDTEVSIRRRPRLRLAPCGCHTRPGDALYRGPPFDANEERAGQW